MKLTMQIAALAALATALSATAYAQAAGTMAQPRPHTPAPEISVTYSTIRTNAPVGSCGCFWTNGVAAEGAVPVFGRFSAVGEFSTAHSGSIPGFAGVGITMVSGMGGLRITGPAMHHIETFGQGLVGGVHAYNSYFPSAKGPHTSADAFSLAAGGGIDVPVSKHILIRAAQIEFQYMQLPNLQGDEQRDLRIAGGLVYRFTR